MLTCFDILALFIFFIIFNPDCTINKENEKNEIRILGLFGTEDEEEEFVFQKAIEEANDDLKRTDRILSKDVITLISPYDNFYLSKTLCSKLDEGEGYGAIFGPNYYELSGIVRSITKAKRIPHIDTRRNPSFENASGIYINLFPDSMKLARAISDVLQDMDWETFTLIYESPESLINLQEVLKKKLGRSKYDRPAVIIKQLPESNDDYRPFLKEIKNSSETHIMLHCFTEKNIIDILEKANEVDLMGPYQNFFVTSLDGCEIDFTKFKIDKSNMNNQANITTLRLISPKNAVMNECIQKWSKQINPGKINITTRTIKTSTALIRDAVLLFTQALKDMPKNFSTHKVACASNKIWEFGENLMDKMKSIDFEGLSGRMEYEQNGRRKYFLLEIVEVTIDGFRILGTWDPDRGVKHNRSISQIKEESSLSIANKTLRVVSKIVPPYLTQQNNGSTGNDRFQGFCKDLLDALAALLKFNYILEIPTDSQPGELNRETARYSGLIGELKELRADLAICDFTVTPERKKAVDFTAPFMSLGISILYTVAKKEDPPYFSFLDPFDITVWIYLMTAYLSLSIALYIIARCTPNEWEGTHPCDQEPEVLENAWNLKNCLWLALGSVLQQGCDTLPKALSTRLTAGMWWFFTLIITSTYTANLAAFLTTQRMELPIKNVEDLANQDEVKYGCLRKGATADFFKTSNDSLYQRMWATMESANPSVFADSNEKGVERVQRSRHKYAFFMESSSIEYQKNLDCDLMQIGNLLDSKFYGIAVPMGSVYKDALTTGILQLKENSVVNELKSKWWRHPENKTCEIEVDKDKDKLGMRNVGGVFLLLILGCILAFFVSTLEFLWNVRKVAVREKIFLSEAFWLELKFAFKCNKTSKPVRHTPQSEMLGTPLSISQINFMNKEI